MFRNTTHHRYPKTLFFVLVIATLQFVTACRSMPALTPTPTHTPTRSPTPTPDSSKFLSIAAPLCQKAFTSPVSKGSLAPPVRALINVEYDAHGWRFQRLPHDDLSLLEVKTLVCIKEQRHEAGKYNDGETAYRRQWETRLVSWPDGLVLGANSFSGGAPPAIKLISGGGYGSEPTIELLKWLIPTLGDKRIILPASSASVYRVYSIAFSPDGMTLASGNHDDTVKLWNLAARQGRPFSGHKDVVSSVAFSPDGKTLASAGRDKTVRLWDVATGQKVHVLDVSATIVAFSPDGKTLASGNADNSIFSKSDETVKLWDVATGQQVRTCGQAKNVTSVAFSPDGKTLASASDNGPVKLWDVATGQEVRTLDVSAAIVAFSPDGKTLASGTGATLKLWDVTTGLEMRTFIPGYQEGVTRLAFSPDGKTLASGSGTLVRLWDVATGQERRALYGHIDTVTSIAFSPDGKTLASGSMDGTVRFWDAATGQ